jgi:hypothetical protein
MRKVTVMSTAVATATVQVKSAWISKINWLQVGGAVLTGAATLMAQNAFGLDDLTMVKVMGALNIVQGVATFIVKTWFTPTVTPNSL